ncbi:hypothetical protein Prudu_1477S000600 [Prunus dulcis]|uniref:DUF4218 domain-containing protein n=1 Tax=Prunus dulcis TaxID=3755 RepID=A0A5H2XRK3_PRUDU|nr:hypothetical protein Prudu_1477S000600 [Prunus dulcis]
MGQLLPVAIRYVSEKLARWMYRFERYMKVLNGYVQNRTRPEGCIAEWYIVEEAVEFFTQHLPNVSTVGVQSSQKMRVSKPLSGCTMSLVDWDLLNQAHLYVLENTEEVLPYIEDRNAYFFRANVGNICSTSRPLIQNLEREQSGCKVSTIALSFNGYALRFIVNLMGKE